MIFQKKKIFLTNFIKFVFGQKKFCNRLWATLKNPLQMRNYEEKPVKKYVLSKFIYQ